GSSVLSVPVVRHHHMYLSSTVRAAADGGLSAVPVYPLHDRTADPVPVRWDLVHIESGAAVAYEHLGTLRPHLHVDRNRWCTVGDGVDHGFPCCGHQRREVFSGPVVAGGHHVDGDPAGIFHLGCRLPYRRHDRVALFGAVVVEPLAQIAFLPAGHGAHELRVVGAGADEGQGLQHRVVQMCGDIGAFGGAGVGGPLGHQIPPQ